MGLYPLAVLFFLFFLAGFSVIYLAYYVFVKFSTSFQNNPSFVKMSFLTLFAMVTGLLLFLGDPELFYWIYGVGGSLTAAYLFYFFRFTVKGSYNLRIFRIERDIDQLKAEKRSLMKRLPDDDPDRARKTEEIDRLIKQETEKLHAIQKEKVLLLSDLAVSKIKKRFLHFDSVINTEDERVEKAKQHLEETLCENDALEELDKESKKNNH